MKRWDTYVCPYHPSRGITCNRRQQKRQKSDRFRMAKQQLCTSARAARIFLCCHCPTTTWKCLISRFVEDVNPRQQLSSSSFSFPLLVLGWWCWWWLGSLSNNDSDGYDRKRHEKVNSRCLNISNVGNFFLQLNSKDCIKVNCTAFLFETSSWYAVVCSSPCKGKITFVAVYHFKVDQGFLVIYSYTCKSTLSHACFDFIAGFSDPSVCQRESW